MKATERLQELLDQKDAELERLQDELNEANDHRERDWEWCRHREIKEPQTLPVPRLEIRCEQLNGWHEYVWVYALIYKHTIGDIIAVPMGSTRTNSSANTPPVFNGVVHTPFREGVHICNDAEHLNLPAFAICDGKTWKLSMKGSKCHQEALP